MGRSTLTTSSGVATRWGLEGAQAILWLRAIYASGDHDAYWTWHIAQEHQRNHLSRYQDSLGLAA